MLTTLRNPSMKKLPTILTCLLLTVSLCACTKKEEEKPQTETIQETAEESNIANDFDTQEHCTVTFGDYELEIPANYRNKEPYYYAESTGHNDLAMLYLFKDSTTVVPSYEMFAMGIDTYIAGFIKESGGSVEVTDKHETTINGIPMYVLNIAGTFGEVEGVMRDYVFVNPSDHALMSLMFLQENTTAYDHFDDLARIVASIRPAE